ncbi:hypothetical protein M2436_003142 [Streptomyces sp. HB372]|nr:hypothetical protein [Streptomyces sp. HB372]
MTRTVRPALLRTAAELDALSRPAGAERAVVMTMGALHEGHAALIRAARATAGADGQVVVTVFVNPLQFGEGRRPGPLSAHPGRRPGDRRGGGGRRGLRPRRGRGLPGR